LSVGAAAGYVLPVFRFYRARNNTRAFHVVPQVTSQTIGLATAGFF
jgi:hypothetical protein